MKNKKMSILLVVIIFLILIPIVVLANQEIRIQVDRILSKEEIDEQREQEKRNWLNNQSSNFSVHSMTEKNNLVDNALLDRYEKKEEEVNIKENSVDEIINRFYKEDYERISTQMANNVDKMSINELYAQEYSKELFNIIIDIIENKDITTNERNMLREFLNEQYVFMDETMKIKVNAVLNDE